MTTDYITVDEFQAYIGTVSANKLDVAQAAVSAASAKVNAFCGRKFYQQAAQTQYFSPAPGNLYILDLEDMDLATTTGLTVTVDYGTAGTYAETRTLNVDFICQPINQSVNGIEGWPFTSLQALNGKIWPQRFQEFYHPTVKVVGTFGWPAVPEPVKTATKITAAQLYKMSDAPMGVAGVNGWGDVRVKEVPLAAEILTPYAKQRMKFLIA